MAERIESALMQRDDNLKALEVANRELKAAQMEMVRHEKLASVGRLSAGIAHEIGNPLSAILGYASILIREEENRERVQYLEYIEKETERIQRIISGLLEFARPQESKIGDLDVNELVRSTLDLISPQDVFRDVDVVLELDEDIPPVRGDRYQLQQGLINILLNGAQAMDGRGSLVVSTTVRTLESGEGVASRRRSTDRSDMDYAALRRSTDPLPYIRAGDRVVTVSVRDSGPGISPEIMERIFDPFFTTKDPGRGTGLGLSITFGIVQAHGGRLRVSAGKGGGAEMAIDLPAAVGEGHGRDGETANRRDGDAQN